MLQWTLSISTTLYLEYLSISNKMFGPLKFPPRTLHSLSLFRTSLSRTFPYIEQIFRSLEPFSLYLEHLHVRFSFSNSQTNSHLNQNKNFDCKWRKICFLFSKSVFCFLLSVKRKLNTETLKEKCDILSHIEKGMINKEAADKFNVPKNTISTWIKNKEKFFQELEESTQSTKNYVVVNIEKLTRLCLNGLLYKGSRIYL